ncbi:hypothetical protein X772_32205 [Mesorhizobium sp. LSJC280B00]|nr:hypothetical protein X772_32205 [Mesorhizobium sp. LSJC280B00]
MLDNLEGRYQSTPPLRSSLPTTGTALRKVV